MPQNASPIKVFLSYSHADAKLRAELEIHLGMLEKQGLIDSWGQHEITGGMEIAGETNQQLEAADIILLLASPDFLSSDSPEMTRALERHAAQEARVIPVLLRPCLWKMAAFSHLSVLPSNQTPLTKWPDRDEAFTDIVNGLIEAIGGRPHQFTSPAPALATAFRPPLPYRCDRIDQASALDMQINEYRRQNARRPVVCLIHGDRLECHGEFLDRLLYLAFPRLFQLQQLSPREYPVSWPKPEIAPGDFARVYRQNLLAALPEHNMTSEQDINQLLQNHPEPLVISSHVTTENFAETGEQSIDALLRFWNDCPELMPGRIVIACLCMKYRPYENAGFFDFAKKKLQKLNGTLREYLHTLSARETEYPNICIVTLPELKAVMQDDVETWNRLEEVNKTAKLPSHARNARISELYQRGELLTPDNRIPMEHLATELVKWFPGDSQ
ncbi:MAG: TIR domain-containing protein [Blastocatellia bacterium]